MDNPKRYYVPLKKRIHNFPYFSPFHIGDEKRMCVIGIVKYDIYNEKSDQFGSFGLWDSDTLHSLLSCTHQYIWDTEFVHPKVIAHWPKSNIHPPFYCRDMNFKLLKPSDIIL